MSRARREEIVHDWRIVEHSRLDWKVRRVRDAVAELPTLCDVDGSRVIVTEVATGLSLVFLPGKMDWALSFPLLGPIVETHRQYARYLMGAANAGR